ncbi:MAG TPA: recombinase family protein [Thermoanaerobaculia bacterium]|nr:recombinase family protein [Thermoanaerobaculia bacterium]
MCDVEDHLDELHDFPREDRKLGRRIGACSGVCIIYERVSTPRQANHRIDDEVEFCRAFAERCSLPVAEVFVDAGESGFHGDRKSYKEMLAYIREHQGVLRYVIVPDFSRVWRNSPEYFSLRATTAKHGVRIVSAREAAVDQSPEGLTIEASLVWSAEYDATVKKEQSSKAQQDLVDRGLWPFRAPLGYRQDRRKGYLVPDEPSASAVRRLFELVGVHGWSIPDVLSGEVDLNLAGEEHTFSAARLRRVLANPLYAGRIVLKSQFRGVAQFEPLVDGDVFDAVQKRITRRAATARRSVPRLPLSSFVTCGECGYFLSGSYTKGKYGWYRCTNGCTKIREAELHPMFIAFADALTATDRTKADLVALVLEKEAEAREVDTTSLERELELIRVRKNHLIAWRLDGSLLEDEWQRQMESERASEEHVLGRLREASNATETTAAQQVTTRILEAPGQVWQFLPVALQRRLQSGLFPERVVLEAGQLGTHAINPVFSGFGEPFTQVRTIACPSAQNLELESRPWHHRPRVERERLSTQYLGNDVQTSDHSPPRGSLRMPSQVVAA